MNTILKAFFVLAAIAIALIPQAEAQTNNFAVVAWGDNSSSQSTVPGGLNGVVAIAAGGGGTYPSGDHSLALKSDRTVVAWGSNDQGQTDVPVGLTNVVAVAGGFVHSLALKSGGTVVAWGDNGVGQSTVPVGLTGVVAIAAGGFHSLALKTDGTVVGWGDNCCGQSTVPTGLDGVVAIAAGSAHSLALKSDGTVVGWGGDFFGQSTVPSGLNGVVAIAAGGAYHQAQGFSSAHSLALKSDGTVVAWGVQDQSTVPSGLNGVVAIAAGAFQSLALKSDGTVVAWTADGQSTVPAGLTGVVAIAAGGYDNLALVAGTNQSIAPVIVFQPFSQVVPSGSNATFNALAVGGPLNYQWLKNGTSIGGATSSAYTISNVRSNDAGNYSVLITNAYGTATGSNALLTVTVTPLIITQQPQNQTAAVGGVANFSVTVSGSPTFSYQWRRDGTNISGATDSVCTISNVQRNDAGRYSVVISNGYDSVTSSNALLTEVPILITQQPQNQVAGWAPHFNVAVSGSAPFGYQWRKDGMVISGATDSAFSISNAQSNDAGNYSVIITNLYGSVTSSNALLARSWFPPWPYLLGSVVSWGDNNFGQTNVPGGLSNVVAIAAGGYHNLALKSDGTVSAWGRNDSGRSTVPVGLTGVVAIAAGEVHSLALKSDGTVVAWGDNSSGESTVPAGLSGVVAIAAAGGYVNPIWGDVYGGYSLALKSDGTVVAWEDNSGESTMLRGWTNVVAIAAGDSHSLALKSDGTVVALGDNTYGQSAVPAGLTGVVAIAAGGYQDPIDGSSKGGHSLALKSDGTVVAWGSVGPAPHGLTGVVAIAAGDSHSLALKSDGTVVAWGQMWDDFSGYVNATVPSGLSGVVAIAAGSDQSLALVAATNQNIVPAVAVQASGKNLLLSWPLSAQGFALQSSTNLTDPNSWTTLTNSPVMVDSQNQVIDIISGPSKFYRLKK